MPGTRYRPPAEGPKPTALITREGHARLKAEFDQLWRVKRPEVVAALAAAAAEGDRSENAEYTYRKKELAGIDRRVRYLSKRLPELKIAEGKPADPGAVYFGAWIELEDETGVEACYRIVGPDETDAARGWISIDAPLARAALKKRVDDEFTVESPGGRKSWVILGVRYEH
jgi:transcription elongation factor GreB